LTICKKKRTLEAAQVVTLSDSDHFKTL